MRHFPTTCSYQGLKARDAGNHFLQPIVNHFLAACTTCISASGELNLSKEAINKGRVKKNYFFSSLLLLLKGGGRRKVKELLGFFINHVFVGCSSMILEPQNMI